jgi:hypothetical protein
MGHVDPGFTLREYTHWFDRANGALMTHRKRDLPLATAR